MIEERHSYKIEITEVTEENGDEAVDLSDVELLIKKLEQGIIVTNEKGKNKGIPYVCEILNIPYMSLNAFLDEILE